eukprot:6189977-Pleurochrysis_carterae.AAC.1
MTTEIPSSPSVQSPCEAPSVATWRPIQTPIKASGDLPEDDAVIYDVSMTANAHDEVHGSPYTRCPMTASGGGLLEGVASSMDSNHNHEMNLQYTDFRYTETAAQHNIKYNGGVCMMWGNNILRRLRCADRLGW